MIPVNTGKAFAKTLTVKKTVGNATTPYSYSVLEAIPDTAFDRMTEADFALLTVEQAQARYTAFQAYAETLHEGLDLSSALTNEPVKDDLTLCPLPGTQRYTVSVVSSGNGTAKVENSASVTVDAGAFVSLAAIANPEYEFDGWYINGSRQPLGATASYQVNGDVRLEARFIRQHVLTDNFVSLHVNLGSNRGADIWASTPLPVASQVIVTIEGPDKQHPLVIEAGNTESEHYVSRNVVETNNISLISIEPTDDQIYRYA